MVTSKGVKVVDLGLSEGSEVKWEYRSSSVITKACLEG